MGNQLLDIYNFDANHIGSMPSLLYSPTHQSPDGFYYLETGWTDISILTWAAYYRYFCNCIVLLLDLNYILEWRKTHS